MELTFNYILVIDQKKGIAKPNGKEKLDCSHVARGHVESYSHSRGNVNYCSRKLPCVRYDTTHVTKRDL